jgi:Na+-translocating ferredoxin:NAD+ oxidoreductase subunit G
MNEINNVGCQNNCESCEPEVPKTKKMPAPAPNAKEMFKIALNLTIACAVAALITGIVFVLTDPVKKENQIKKEETVIRKLLSLKESDTITEVSRILIIRNNETMIVYQKPDSGFLFNERGEFKEKLDTKNEEALVEKFGKDNVKTVGRFFMGHEGSEIKGFVVEGNQMGFKNNIKFFLALDNSLNIRGIEILEHEEDPGLGAEIVRPYIKNQFAGRTVENISTMEVVKEPLPSDWNIVLNDLEKTALEQWKEKNKALLDSNKKIYAITGATISTSALTDGVKSTLFNFKKRIELLRPYL